MIKLERPVVFLDLEATGVAPSEDRIVDIALLKRLPDGSQDALASLVNPGVPIPPEATAVHGITNEMARGQPSLAQLAPRVIAFIEGSDLGGFNILRFDIPMLQAELKRAGFELSLEGRRIVDAYAIFHKLEPRSLSAAYQFYCGKALPKAHRAEPDAMASWEVFQAQVERYPQLPRDLAALSAFCQARDPRNVDSEGKFVWRNGEAAFNFGKHRTQALREVARREPDYLEWLMRAEKTTPEIARICQEALSGKFPVKGS